MIKFVLPTLVAFGIGLTAIPEAWLTSESTAQSQPAVQTEPDVTIDNTVINGQSVETISVLGESAEQVLSREESTRTDSKQANLPDFSDANVL